MVLTWPRGLSYVIILAMVLAAMAFWATPAHGDEPTDIATGGKLYDKWWTAVPGVAAPTGNQPLWATQTTNTRSGLDTWRCKECHGWDYKGKDGAYGSGSHKTGFSGVMGAATTKTVEELAAIIKGSANPQHNFSTALDNDSITKLAKFLKNGLIDTTTYINSATKKPIGANAARGQEKYASTCAACHGADGTALNFGSAQAPEYVGTLASDNPWEFLHKVRAGQPGAPMPAGIVSGWTVQDAVDVLGHAQTLPTGAVAAPAAATATTAPAATATAAPAATPARVLPSTGDSSPPYVPIAAGAGLALVIGAALLRQRRKFNQ